MSPPCFAHPADLYGRGNLNVAARWRRCNWARGIKKIGLGLCLGFALLCALLWSASAHGMAENTCTAPQAAAPCRTPASLNQNSPEPQINLGAGNPIHLATGNKYQRETDLQPASAWPWLAITRHYSAQNSRSAFMGQGWLTDFDIRLRFVAHQAVIDMPDGSHLRLNARGPDHYAATGHGQLQKMSEGWRWHWHQGRQLTFDMRGALIQVNELARQTRLVIKRQTSPGPLLGTIETVTTGTGIRDRLVFKYQVVAGNAYIQHIDSPAGRFQYEYEAATESGAQRLVAMQRPDGSRRVYLYEAEHQGGNPYALTGIENRGAPPLGQHTRQNRWIYNGFNQVVRYGLGPDEYQVQYLLRRTRLQRADGTTTDIDLTQRRGRSFVTAVTGAACPGCPAPGTRADYDAAGRLTRINGSSIERDGLGRLQQLTLAHAGWDGLALSYDAHGRRHAWQSRLTGAESLGFNARGLIAQRRFADGRVWQYDYDDAGRPARLDDGAVQTVLRWRGTRLIGIQHPNESETRQYDDHGRMIRRSLMRQSHQPMTETFAYDADHRLIHHQLAEGGALHYIRGHGRQLLELVWEDAAGRRHTVITHDIGRPGYRYGNGLRLVTARQSQRMWWILTHERASNKGQLAERAPRVRFGHRYAFDTYGRVHSEQIFQGAHDLEAWTYSYDRHSRLIGAHESGTQQDRRMHWYAYDENGATLDTRHPALVRNASGLPVRDGTRRLEYGTNRRLTAVWLDDGTVVRYKHNAFGQRIGRRTDKEHTQYWYLDRRLVAESTIATEVAADANAKVITTRPRITRRYLYADNVPVGFIDYDAQHPQGRLNFIHADLIGTPRLVSSTEGHILWEARYQPYGQVKARGIDFNLRGVGQYADPLTGWYDNLLRTYDPQRGQFLEPDPLGPIPGNQALGYASQQPRRFADPLGLLLFAFDGTRNDASTQTNVWKLAQRYGEGPVFYQGGPGNPYTTDWDALTAYSAPRILERQWSALLDTLVQTPSTPDQAIPIDIIGYSRGAALARHFGNQVNQFISNGQFAYHDLQRGMVTACVDLRFMGIFDTVAQFGLNGTHNAAYDLTVDAGWQWVAHAIALHERRWLFPLASAADRQPGNVIEAPFVGAHADIGGGVLVDDAGTPNRRGDLSDISLNWMLWQARAAGVEFNDGPAEDDQVSAPYLHDERDSTLRSLQNGDRRLDRADGSLWHDYQDDHARLGRSTREATEAFIARYDDWRRQPGNEVGTVDMDAYSQWLEQTLGTTAQGDSSYH